MSAVFKQRQPVLAAAAHHIPTQDVAPAGVDGGTSAEEVGGDVILQLFASFHLQPNCANYSELRRSHIEK